MVMSVSSVAYQSSNRHAASASSSNATAMRRVSFETNRPALFASGSPGTTGRPPTSRSHIPCKFYRSGCCYRGDHCQFSHDASVQQQLEQSIEEFTEADLQSSDEKEERQQLPPLSATNNAMSSTTHHRTITNLDDSIPLAWTLTPAPPRLPQVSQAASQQAKTVDESLTGGQQQQICRFFLRGICAHGDSCRFSHVPAASNTSLRPEAVQAKLSNFSPRAPGRFQAIMPPARQMSLDLPQHSTLMEEQPSPPAESVSQSMLGKGISHSSLLDADPQLLIDTLPGPSRIEMSKRISSSSSPSTSQRRTSVSHGDKGNMNYAAAVSASALQQAATKPQRSGSIFGDRVQFASTASPKGIAIRQQQQQDENAGLASQSVPMLSSSGSFFDMLSSEQDTFNYARHHMSSGESNSSVALPGDDDLAVSNSLIDEPSIRRGTNGSLAIKDSNQLPTRRVSFNGKPTERTGMLSELTTATRGRRKLADGDPLFSAAHEDAAVNGNNPTENANRVNAWWSVDATPTPNGCKIDQHARENNSNNYDAATVADADLGMQPFDLYFGALAGTTDDDDDAHNFDHQAFAASSFSYANALQSMMPAMYGDPDSAAACLAAAAAAVAAANFDNMPNIPLSNDNNNTTGGSESSADMMLTNNDMNNGTVIRGEVFYSPTPPHRQYQQNLMNPFASLLPVDDAALSAAVARLFDPNKFSVLNYDNVPSVNGGSGGDDGDEWHREWQKKRVEGQPDMFPQAAGSSRRVAVCRAGLAGRCFDKDCMYRHDIECEMCGCEAIDPENPAEHMRECLATMEANMALSFSIARSEHRECGICQEEIMESNRRFGLLPNCKHVFCLNCIRGWRDRKQQGYDKEAVRGCPLCRVKSDFVLPSQYFLDDDEEKQKVIERYQQEMKKIHCKYFNRGAGDCPFGDSCFYMHTDRRGQPITGLRPLFDSHTLLGCAFIEVEQGMTQRQRRQQRRQQQQQQQQNSSSESTSGGNNSNNRGGMSSSSSSASLSSTATLQRRQDQAQQTNAGEFEELNQSENHGGHVGTEVGVDAAQEINGVKAEKVDEENGSSNDAKT